MRFRENTTRDEFLIKHNSTISREPGRRVCRSNGVPGLRRRRGFGNNDGDGDDNNNDIVDSQSETHRTRWRVYGGGVVDISALGTFFFKKNISFYLILEHRDAVFLNYSSVCVCVCV